MSSYVSNDSYGRAYVRHAKHGNIHDGTTVVIDRPGEENDGLIGRLEVRLGLSTVIVQAGCVHINVYPGEVRPLKMGDRVGDPEANAHLAQIAEMVGECDDIGAAWESVAAIIAERDRMKEGLEKALVQISGGLCYFSADAKHAQLRDAEKTLEHARDGGPSFEKTVYGEEPGDDWSLELHVFHHANDPKVPVATRELLKTLWKAYCEKEDLIR